MKGRLTVGGYALVLHSMNERNIGKVVKLVRFHGEGTTADLGFRNDYWVIECDSWITTVSSVHGIGIPAIHLIPLGDEESKKQFEKEKELENA